MPSLLSLGFTLCSVYLAGIGLLVARLTSKRGSITRSDQQRKNTLEKVAPADPKRHHSSPPTLFDRPCTPPHAHFDYCNTSASIDQRIHSLLTQLSITEKISLLGNNASAVVKNQGAYLPPYQWWSECLHGVASYDCCPPNMIHATSFPQVCSIGVSFNTSLYRKIGHAIHVEAIHHYFHVKDAPGLTYWSPNINLFRDVRWGRGQEVVSEDVHVTKLYAKHMVQSLQGNNDKSVAACCKHFFGYSVETTRESLNVEINARDLHEFHLPAFEECVKSGVMSIMCSYNAVNAVPTCAHSELLTGFLRQDLGFDGYIVGDCGAVQNIYDAHHYADSPAKAVSVAMRAGVDLDCGGTFQQYGEEAYKLGLVDERDIDRALRNLLRVQFRLGYYDGPAMMKGSHDRRAQQQQFHNELALDAARQGIVLLKNEPPHSSSAISQRALPLSLKEHASIALLGPNANATTTMLGNYYGIAPFLVSPLQGFHELGGVTVHYEQGCNIASSIYMDESSLCNTAIDFNGTDAVVLVVGLDQSLESEGVDRVDLLLPAVQRDFIEETLQCVHSSSSPGQPVILVVMSGGPIDVSLYKHDERIQGILYVGYPGQSGGTAIADVIYGNYSPSGRLSTSIYENDSYSLIDLFDMRMRPNVTEGYPGRTYRFYTGKLVYPFGYGLSYSEFEYVHLKWNTSLVSIDVRNHGPFDAAHSVLLFHVGPNAGRDGEPLKTLVGFDKVWLGNGETQTVLIAVEETVLSQAKAEPGHKLQIGVTDEHVIGIDGYDQSGASQ
jgi:beta-D-xylosidase 4